MSFNFLGVDCVNDGIIPIITIKVAANVQVLPKAGYFMFRQPIPKLIYFLLLMIEFVVD